MQTFFNYIFLLLLTTNILIFAKSKDPVRAQNGMVVSASDIASLVGVDILEKGGNAVDAAVATGFALAVTYPQAGNIGGGGFMVLHLADGTNTTIDYREKAPQTAFRDMYLNKNGDFDLTKSTEGWASSGVPGSVAGMLYALEKYGTMTREEILQPAIKLASNGFLIDYRFAEALNLFKDKFHKIKSSVKIFTKKDESFSEGELFIQKDLAKTLRAIKLNGSDGFYKGEVADLIAKQSIVNGGFITKEDLANYKPIERSPIIGNYRNNKIISMCPPSSGGIALVEALNSIEHFSFEEDSWGSSEYIHSARMAVLVPIPNKPTKRATIARLGIVWPIFTTPRTVLANFLYFGRVRISTKGTDVAIANILDITTIERCCNMLRIIVS